MKFIAVLFLGLILNTGYAQFSIESNIGIAEFRKKLPYIGTDNIRTLGLGVSLSYTPNVKPIEINLKSHFLHFLHLEKSYFSPIGGRIYADYINKLDVLAGIKSIINKEKFVSPFVGIQIGYWRTEIGITVYDHEFNFPIYRWHGFANQFVFGPNLGLQMGKNRLKTIIELEELFFSGYNEAKIFDERLTRISIGIRYTLNNKADTN